MTKISSLTSLTGAGVTAADDLVPIVDMSEMGTARNKKITVAELKEAVAPGTAAALDIDTDDTLAADSDSLIPTQQAVKAYVDANAGGANDLDDLSDVDLTGLADGDTLVYDSGSGDFIPVPLPGGGSGGTVPDGGATGQVLTKQSGTDQDIGWENPSYLGAVHVQDQKASGSDGGTFTSGAWQTRTLNTEVHNSITGASLASNQITLPAGTYDIVAYAPAMHVNNHQARLQNITDAATTLLGTEQHNRATSGTDGGNYSVVQGRFTIAGSKAFELQHRGQTTAATFGFGLGSGTTWGTVVFSDVFIRRVA